MGEHKLNELVEDTLQHYGVKGMKWGVRRSPSQLAAAGGGGGGSSDEDSEDRDDTESKVKEVMDHVNKKISEMSKSIKEKGKSLLTKIFGESKVTYKPAKSDARLSKNLGKAMKKAMAENKVDPAVQRAIDKSKADGRRAKNSNPEVDRIINQHKEKGFKKHDKSTKSLKERGYKITVDRKSTVIR